MAGSGAAMGNLLETIQHLCVDQAKSQMQRQMGGGEERDAAWGAAIAAVHPDIHSRVHGLASTAVLGGESEDGVAQIVHKLQEVEKAVSAQSDRKGTSAWRPSDDVNTDLKAHLDPVECEYENELKEDVKSAKADVESLNLILEQLKKEVEQRFQRSAS